MKIVDSVGAGDSITASLIDGMRRELDIKESLERAQALASFVVGSEGATPNYTPKLKKELGIE